MLKFFRKSLLFFLIFIVHTGQAQNALNYLGLTSSKPATAAYSTRLLSSNYTGPLLRIQITGTSNFYDVYPDASADKNISTSSPISAVQSTFDAAIASASANTLSSIITAGTTNATVVTWYDQSGNGNHALRNSASAQPVLISAGSITSKNSRPAVRFSSGNFLTKNLSSLSATTNHSISTVGSPASTNNNGVIFALSDDANGDRNSVVGVGYAANTSWWFGGVSQDGPYSGGTSTTDLAIRTKVYTNASTTPASKINGYFNGNNVFTTTVNYNLTSTKIIIGQQLSTCCGLFTGDISETVLFTSNLSDLERETIENSQSVYYGVSVFSNAFPNTAGPASSTPTLCANTALTDITHTTTGATGIGTATGLPPGVTASWASNTITISGTPTTSGTYNYSIPLTGGSGSVSATGTITVNPSPSLLGNALNFDGVNDYVTVPANSALNLTGSISISAWVKRQNSGKDICIVGKDNYAAGTGYSLWIYGATDNHKIAFRFGNRGCRSATSIPLDEWTHVTATYDGTTSKVYINGVLSNSCTGLIGPASNTSNLYIGTPQDQVGSTLYNFVGNIDEVAIYNTAISATDVSFRMKNELVGNESGLLAYYNFNAGTASSSNTGITSLADKTSNAFNGTLNGFGLSGSTSNWVYGPEISNTTSTTICVNSTTQLSHSNIGVWSSSNAGVASVNSTGLVTGVSAGTATITYTVTNSSGCSVSSVTTVTVSDLPFFSLQLPSTAQSICAGTGSLSVDADPGSGSISSYAWYSNASALNSGGSLLVTNSTSSTSNSYVPTSSAYYYVVVTNNYGCSSASDVSGQITITASPTISSQPSSSTQSLCINTAATALSVTAAAGSGSIKSYKWYSNTTNSTTGGTLVSTTSTSSTSNSYTPSTASAGTLYYYCVITNTNDCSTTSAVSGGITVGAASVGGTATASSALVVSGGTTTLSLSGHSGNIQWQQSANGSTWSNVSGGSGASTSSYTTAAISATTYYRAAVTSGNCTVAYSNTITIGLYGVTTVTSFSPESGITGSNITITGTNFNTTYSNNTVYFGATRATVIAGTSTSLTVTVPIGASYKPITVLNTETKLIGSSARPFRVTFTGAISATMFDTRFDIDHNEQQYRMGLGDFNNDGLADLAVPSNNTSNIAVFKNQSTSGSLSFAARSNFGTTGTGQNDLTVADFNGDGKLDMVSASKTQGSIYILVNNTTTSTISFGAPISYTPGVAQDAPGIAVDDFDRDGKMDIVVASGYNQIKLYRNTSSSGSTTFSLSNTLTTGAFIYTISTADLNGDSYPEILTTNVDGNSVSVFKNTSTSGSPNFDTKVDFTPGGSPRWVAVGDMDGDNKVDIVTPNYNSTASVLLNQISSSSGAFTTSSFATTHNLVAPAQANGVAINDLDGDGKMDIVLVGTSPQVISVIKNNSTSGALSFSSKLDFTGKSNYVQFNTHIADFDGDGRSDVATTGWQGVSIYRYACISPTFTTNPSTTAQNLCLNGSPTALSVTATAGTGSISGYQWYSNTNNANSGGTLISGATSSSYTPLTTQAGSLYYYCAVTNSSGCTKNSAVSGLITVSASSVAGTISGAGSVTSGTNSTVLTLSGYTGSIQWQSSTNNSTYTNISGATSATYTATNLTATTFYKAVVTNGVCASATSSAATITITSPSTAFGITGSTTVNTISNNVAAVVDPNIVVTANGTISGFTVSITSDYTDGDILGYTGTLPYGVNVSAFDVTSRSLYFTGSASAADWQALLRTVTLTSTSNCYPTNRKISFLPSNKYYNYFNGHYYEYVSTALSWTAAKTAAASRSFYGRKGYLVTISSEAENNFIWKLIAHDSWIGASCLHTEINSALGYTKFNTTTYGQFYWVTGPDKGTPISNGLGGSVTPVSGIYSNWSPGEPNNYKGWGENSGHMFSSSGYWNDYKKEGANNGRHPIPYIVEFGGSAGDDTSATVAFTRDIIITGSPAGTVSGAATVCNGTNSTTLTYSGGGTIQNWEYSTDNFATAGIAVASTSSTLTVTNLSSSRYYRAVVNATGCTGLASSAALIDVATTSSGTITALSGDVCAGGNAALTLNGNSGDIQKWQVSTSADFTTGVTDISNTTNNLSYPLTSNGSYYFRASVLNSACVGGTAVYTEGYPVTVTTGTAPVGGTVNSVAYCGGSNSGTLTLSGATGTSYQWEVSTDGGVAYTDASSTSTTQSYTGISSLTKYRVLVTSGSCGSVYSSVGTISIGGSSGAQWTGTVSTDWGNTANWCGYVIGDNGMDVEISATATYAPVLDQNRTIGNLNFNASGKSITLGNYTLTVSSVTGAGSSNYVKTNGTGKLKVSIGNGISTSLPVGNTTYNPVTLTNNSGSRDDFAVLVMDEVYANAVSGTLVTNGRVQRSWEISKTNANGGDGVDLTFNWNAGETTALSSPALFSYASGMWTLQSGTSSSTSTSLSFTGYTGSFTAFAVMEPVYTWTGAGGNSLWNNAANWSTGVSPTAASDIVISSGSPQLNIDFTVGESLTLSGTGSLIVNAGKTLSIAAGGIADFGGKEVVFKSDATGTGQLGVVAGTLTGATNVQVERHIPAGKRAFRFFSSSVTTTGSIRDNWMEGATPAVGNLYPYRTQSVYNPNLGYGTLITGTGGATNGFDASETNNPSLFTFNNATGAWAEVTSTAGTITAGNAYRLLVRGDRSYNIMANTPPTPTATILRTRGTLVTGTRTTGTHLPALNPASGGWSLVGNPYQSVVDMSSASVVKTNLTDYYYVWDPRMGTRGAYVAFNYVTNTSANISSAVNQYVQPGQAFFVQSNAASSVLQFTEASKGAASGQTATFGKNDGKAGIPGNEGYTIELTQQRNEVTQTGGFASLSMLLYETDSLTNNGTTADAARVLFATGYNNNVDLKDGRKFTNLDETMSVKQNNTLLSMELRALPDTGTVLPLNITQYRATKYTLRVYWDKLLTDSTRRAYLKDKFTAKEYLIERGGAYTDLAYTITADAKSSAADRFEVVFKSAVNVVTAVTNWSNGDYIKVYPNPVVTNMQVDYKLGMQRELTLKVYDMSGREVLERKQLKSGDRVNLSGLLRGIYPYHILDKTGKLLMAGKLLKD